MSEVGDPLTSLGFAPRINPSDFCGFFITATAWGQFKQKGDEEMRDGTAEVKYYDFFFVWSFFLCPSEYSQSLEQTQFFADAVFRFHTTELKQMFMNLRYSLVFAMPVNFSLQYPLLFVFQLCVHYGELRLSQLTLKSRASSALARKAGGINELLVTTVAQVKHLSFAKMNSKDRKTLLGGWIKFIVNLFCVFLTRTLNSSQLTSILVEFCSKLARVCMSHFQVWFFVFTLPLRWSVFRWLRCLY